MATRREFVKSLPAAGGTVFAVGGRMVLEGSPARAQSSSLAACYLLSACSLDWLLLF
jgi:hypothetical protein